MTDRADLKCFHDNCLHGDEDGRHAGKGANFFCDIQACGNIRLLQAILLEFSFFTMSGFLAFR